MRALSRIAVVATLVAGCASAQSAPSSATPAPTAAGIVPGGPTQPDATQPPIPVAHPPAPPDLAPLSQDFQAAMANSQLQTYRYNQLTEQALALKKLCETGFGPADICPKATAAAAQSIDAAIASNAGDLPTVAEINGVRGTLSAVLLLADGRRVTVRQGSMLADGLRVAAVTDDDVHLTKGTGHELVLSFSGSGQAR